jgi:DNA invertase Pin-like site-specific DNA recombinase/DNA-binding transcriptional regulator YdaS (Cro superfamily)
MTGTLQVRAGVYGRQSRGKAKSISEQLTICSTDVLDQGWTITAKYQDGSSASRYARQQRDDWQRVLADIDAGKLDVLVLWESNRGDRQLTTWSSMLDLCRDRGVLIRITNHDTTYDPRKRVDWERLAHEGISSASDSDKISVGVRRGHAGAAMAGRPSHGKTPFGYRRRYDQDTGELIGQEADPETAWIPREIITRVAKAEPISTITDDLNERKVQTAGAVMWYRQRVRDIATNVAYIGKRTYNGRTYDGNWPGLVDEITFYAAQRVLTDPARVTTRPGRQRWLLSYLGVCDVCDGPLCVVLGRYRCLKSSCVTIVRVETDNFMEKAIRLRLQQPDVYESFRKAGEAGDQEVMAARTEAAQLRESLNQWRRSAAKNQTSPESLAVIEADLTGQIRVAELRADQASIPVALRRLLEPGADFDERWAESPIPARRDAIRAVVDLRVGPASLPGSRSFDRNRLDNSRWAGDSLTWGQHRAGR